jgi:nitrate/nitrite transporter NarK
LGKLADTVGKHWKTPWVTLGLLCIVPTIAYAVITPSLNTCLTLFTIATFFVGGAMSLTWVMLLDVCDIADVPRTGGFILMGGSLAGIIAPSLVGFVLQATNSFDFAYFVFAAISLIGGLCGLLLFRREKQVRVERGVAL